jgi:TIR domain
MGTEFTVQSAARPTSMADVFISYSKSHTEATRNLARELEGKGVMVWWDTELLAGESFRERIIQEIKACKAAIVIWTPDSVHSDYVLSEAERARVARKLIQLRTPDLEPDELPPPFDTMHASLIDDQKAIYGSLAKLGVLRDDKVILGDSRLSFNWRPRRRKLVRIVLPALASLIALGALWTIISFRAKVTSAPTLQNAERPVTTIAQRFLDELNTGLRDASLFGADVRLGRLGLMSRVEAVTELRKLQAKYAEIHCRVGRNGVLPREPQHEKNGLRGQIDTECDFTDRAGVTTTQRFPLEIEAAPAAGGKFLISGLWQPEEMWLWQARSRD